MIQRLEALNFRCLRYIAQEMGQFHVLVGPNASGKTTFLDVISFLGDLVSEGLDTAIARRTSNFEDLLWQRQGRSFELAIPAELREPSDGSKYERVRYEVAVGFLDSETREVGFLGERVVLKRHAGEDAEPRHSFPESNGVPLGGLLKSWPYRGSHLVIDKESSGHALFLEETPDRPEQTQGSTFRLGPKRSALANLPEDETRFPVATWLKAVLIGGIQELVLNSQSIRRASAPGKGAALLPDGSNLPWVVAELERHHPDRVVSWIAHLRTALPDLEGIRTIERPDDRHRYLMLCYEGGLEVPSWMVSDGTLRLLALTLPAYLPDFSGIYLVEEPENGIHPKAVETMFQSLASGYDAQLLLATHSPVILGIVDPSTLLCFAKTEEGATDLVLGSEHPLLRDWHQEVNLSTLFASGTFG